MIKLGNFKTRKDLRSDAVIQAPATTKQASKFDWSTIQEGLKQDLLILKTLAGHEEKQPYKAELIKKYEPIVAQLLASHSNLAGLDIIWWWYLWRVDVEGIEAVYADFKAVIDKNLQTPLTWKSNASTALVDMVLKHCQEAYDNKEEANFTLLEDIKNDIEQGQIALNTALKSKIYRLLGRIADDNEDLQQAHDLYVQALKFDPKCGRKKRLEEIKEALSHG